MEKHILVAKKIPQLTCEQKNTKNSLMKQEKFKRVFAVQFQCCLSNRLIPQLTCEQKHTKKSLMKQEKFKGFSLHSFKVAQST